MHACRFRSRAAFALLAGLLVSSVPAAELPADLNAVPRDATCFMHVRAADLWNHEALADLRFLVKRAGAETLKKFQDMFAPDPASIERVTIVMPTPRDFNEPIPFYVHPEVRSPLVIIRTQKPFDPTSVMEKLALRDKFYHRHHYYFNEEGWRVLLIIDARTFLVGVEESLFSYFDALDNSLTQAAAPAGEGKAKGPGGPLETALQEAAGTNHVTVGINPRGFTAEAGFQFLPPAVQPLFEARCWVGSIHLDRAINARVRSEFAEENNTQDGEKAFRAAIELGRSGLKLGLQEIEQQLLRDKDKATIADLPEKFAMVVGIGALREMDRVLVELPIERKQKEVVATLKYDQLNATNNMALVGIGMASALAAGSRAYADFATVAEKIAGDKENPRQTHLKRIAAALEKHHQDKGSYPPAAIYDKHGRALLSWRVALLPYFGDAEKQLYNQFRLDEPWDGPTNRALLKQVPQCYGMQNQGYYPNGVQGKTTTLAFTGKGTVFEGPKGVAKNDIGPKTMLLFLGDGQKATYWSKPGDLGVEPGKPLPELFPRYGGEVYALLADGSFKSIQREIDQDELRAMVYRKKGPIAADPAAKYPEAAWDDFMQIDDAGSQRALHSIRKLAAAPEQALPFLKSRLKPVAEIDRKQVAQMITDLDGSSFQTRKRATLGLSKSGVLILETLRETLQDPNLRVEVRKRIRRIIDQMQETAVTAEELQAVRAVLVLQQVGSAEAQAFLRELAGGADGAMLTAHARKALRVLAAAN